MRSVKEHSADRWLSKDDNNQVEAEGSPALFLRNCAGSYHFL
ncbi:MAG: hypothetical protein AAF944_23035 [Bacteroidota bacterium]